MNGELHPRLERGPLYFQKKNREAIRAHVELEKAAKQQIWLAKQNLAPSALVSKEDEMPCSGLACQANREGLDWCAMTGYRFMFHSLLSYHVSDGREGDSTDFHL